MADMEMNTATTNAAEPTDEKRKTSRLRKRDVSKYVPDRDSVGDIRNALLVVSALITAATFAVGVNPPGGVWQETKDPPNIVAGKSVLASYSNVSFTMFLFTNSAAFSSSNMVIGQLVYDFPFYLEIWLAMACMSFTYGVSVSSVSPSGNIKQQYVYLAMFLPYMLRAVFEVMKRIWKIYAPNKLSTLLGSWNRCAS